MDSRDVATGVIDATPRNAVHGNEIENEIVVIVSSSCIDVHPKYGYEVSCGAFIQWRSDQVRIA